MKKHLFGFTLVELMVVIAIISILAAIVYANFGESRAAARDDIRKTHLKELQLAIELYKAQNGVYPEVGCVPTTTPSSRSSGYIRVSGVSATQPNWLCSTQNYIAGLTPDFIAALPVETVFANTRALGYIYTTNASRSDYKLYAWGTVESKKITSYSDEFARCPADDGSSNCSSSVWGETYAVYSPGAASW